MNTDTPAAEADPAEVMDALRSGIAAVLLPYMAHTAGRRVLLADEAAGAVLAHIAGITAS